MFENLVKTESEYSTDYTFEYNGVRCQVNETDLDGDDYEISMYYDDKFINWGVINGEKFIIGNPFPLCEFRELLDEFSKFFGYSFPTTD